MRINFTPKVTIFDLDYPLFTFIVSPNNDLNQTASLFN
jgi:hypothetical protein